jgi:hypothetical protein
MIVCYVFVSVCFRRLPSCFLISGLRKGSTRRGSCSSVSPVCFVEEFERLLQVFLFLRLGVSKPSNKIEVDRFEIVRLLESFLEY